MHYFIGCLIDVGTRNSIGPGRMRMENADQFQSIGFDPIESIVLLPGQ